MGKVYYIMYHGQVTGPMSREQMAAYNVTGDTQVSADGGEWRPLYTYPELMEAVSEQGPGNGMPLRQRQVGFMEAVKRAFSNYACFSGRASRSEFWWWALFTMIVGFVVNIFATMLFSQDMNEYLMRVTVDPASAMEVYPWKYYGFSSIFQLLLLLPNLSLAVRRLHDTGRSGWWILINCIICIGTVIYLVWLCKESEPRDNKYGPVPNME